MAWVGEGLAARLLGMQGMWNYPAFFDYVDRWMFEPGDAAEQRRPSWLRDGYDYTASWEAEGQSAGYMQGELPAVHVRRRHVGGLPRRRGHHRLREVGRPLPQRGVGVGVGVAAPEFLKPAGIAR